MWDFSVIGAMRLMADTLPFVGLRVAVYGGIAAGYMLATGVGAAMGDGVGAFAGWSAGAGGWANTALCGGAIGFGLFGMFMCRLRGNVLYRVKAGHIAILVERVDGKALPAGKPQIRHAAALVRGHFAEASTLYVVDKVIRGVVTSISAMVRGMPSILPLPGRQQLAGVVRFFLRIAVGFVDQLILARIMRVGAANPWQSAQESLILYGQNSPIMSKNAAWLALLIYMTCLLLFLILLVPAAGVAYLILGASTAGGYALALLFTWSIKAALIEPLAIICLMQVYFGAIEGQRPDPEWGARLEQMSDKFRQLKARAWAQPVVPATAVMAANPRNLRDFEKTGGMKP